MSQEGHLGRFWIQRWKPGAGRAKRPMCVPASGVMAVDVNGGCRAGRETRAHRVRKMMQRFVPSGQSAGGEARQLHGVRRQSEVGHGRVTRRWRPRAGSSWGLGAAVLGRLYGEATSTPGPNCAQTVSCQGTLTPAGSLGGRLLCETAQEHPRHARRGERHAARSPALRRLRAAVVLIILATRKEKEGQTAELGVVNG